MDCASSKTGEEESAPFLSSTEYINIERPKVVNTGREETGKQVSSQVSPTCLVA